jgi:hypothetical protein
MNVKFTIQFNFFKSVHNFDFLSLLRPITADSPTNSRQRQTESQKDPPFLPQPILSYVFFYSILSAQSYLSAWPCPLSFVYLPSVALLSVSRKYHGTSDRLFLMVPSL